MTAARNVPLATVRPEPVEGLSFLARSVRLDEGRCFDTLSTVGPDFGGERA